MNEIIENLRILEGYSMVNKNINVMCYADKMVLMENCKDNLQRLLDRFKPKSQTIKHGNVDQENKNGGNCQI